ncbi:hypothetical protein [Desulfovibrio falkowii]|uniref:Uncharacterized protein n=1 Tax=Desulfovibrio falkowii TaxID=3136602 RepID=A0ABQ0E9N1_9BACT
MGKHTPGPWKKTQNDVSAGTIGVVYHGDGKTWFDISAVNCNYETFLEQQPYNSDLIVSAPDLYASLNRALDALERADDYGVPGLCALIEDVSDVLVKARGA